MDQATADKSDVARAPWQSGWAANLSASWPGSRILTIGSVTLGVATIGLGVLGLRVGDFALQWQPVPEGIPARALLAYLTAIVLTALGVGLLIPRFRAVSAACHCAMFFLWALALHGPKLFSAPLDILPWLAFCEILAIAAGSLMLAAEYSSSAAVARVGPAAGRLLFGVCLPVFGASHFAYIPFTADMIPAWIPAHLFWAWFTGAGHVAAGVSILTGVLARAGSFLFAVMVSGFVLFLHVPRVLGDPTSRQEWTMLVMAATIAGAAWCVAGSMATRRSAAS